MQVPGGWRVKVWSTDTYIAGASILTGLDGTLINIIMAEVSCPARNAVAGECIECILWGRKRTSYETGTKLGSMGAHTVQVAPF